MCLSDERGRENATKRCPNSKTGKTSLYRGGYPYVLHRIKVEPPFLKAVSMKSNPALVCHERSERRGVQVSGSEKDLPERKVQAESRSRTSVPDFRRLPDTSAKEPRGLPDPVLRSRLEQSGEDSGLLPQNQNHRGVCLLPHGGEQYVPTSSPLQIIKTLLCGQSKSMIDCVYRSLESDRTAFLTFFGLFAFEYIHAE